MDRLTTAFMREEYAIYHLFQPLHSASDGLREGAGEMKPISEAPRSSFEGHRARMVPSCPWSSTHANPPTAEESRAEAASTQIKSDVGSEERLGEGDK